MKRGDLFKKLRKTDPRILLILIVLFGLFLRIVFFRTSINPDSLTYAGVAKSISEGKIDLAPRYHQSARFALLFPMVFFIKLFGAGDFVYAMWPLICSLGNIVLVFYFGKMLYNEKAGLWAAFLMSFFPFEVFHSTAVLPDVTLGFFLGLAVYFFLKADFTKNIRKEQLYYYLSGIFLALAHFTKMIAVIIFLFFFAYVLWKRKFKMTIIFFILGYLTLIGPYYLYLMIARGSFFWQISYWTGLAVYGYKESLQFQAMRGFLFSIFAYPYYMFISIYKTGFFYYFIALAVVYLAIKREKKAYVLMLWAGILLAYLTFGFAKINPLIMIHKEQRFLSIIKIPVILLLAIFFSRKEKFIKYLRTYGLAFLIITSLFFTWFTVNVESSYRNIKKAAEYVEAFDKNMYADDYTIAILNYFSGYKTENKLISYMYYNWASRKNNYYIDLSTLNDAFIIIDRGEIAHLKSHTYVRFPDEINNPPENWELVKLYNSSLDSKFLFLLDMIEKICPVILKGKVSEKIQGTINKSKKPIPVEIYYIP